jgi:hypothetical protein
MPKALSPLQSVQRSYTSKFSVVSWSCWVRELSGVELVAKKGRKGTCSSAATRIVLAKDARRAVAVDTVTAE